MKKWFSVLLTACLLCTLCVPAFAASAKVDAAAALSEDGVLTVTLSVPENSGLATFETMLHYDEAALTLQDVAYGAGSMTTSNTDTAGRVGLYMIWTETQEAAATLVTVTFQVSEDAKGTTVLSFTDTKAHDDDGSAMAVTVGDDGSLSYALTEEQPVTDTDIPPTAGRYAAVGGAAVAAVAVVVALVAAKRRRTPTD